MKLRVRIYCDHSEGTDNGCPASAKALLAVEISGVVEAASNDLELPPGWSFRGTRWGSPAWGHFCPRHAAPRA